MPGFTADVLAGAAREREVRLTTYGRKTGKPHPVTIWISTDGERLFIRSGGGLARHWPQNLLARDHAILKVGGMEMNVRGRHLTDVARAREVSQLVARKYGASVRSSREGQPPTPAEQATFELLPVAS